MNKKWIIAIVTIVIIGAILFIGSRAARQNAAAQTPEPGDIVTAYIGDLSASATSSGQVQPLRQITLSAQTPGKVEAVNVRIGDEVQAGDLLMQLETASMALNVANAEQNLRLKQSNLENLLEPPQEKDIAAAEAAVASAQANLDDLLAGPSAAEMAAYEASLRSSQASLASASANLSTAQNSIKNSQVQAAEAALTAAQLQLQSAQEANEENTNEQTHVALLEAQQAVVEAEATLNSLLAGPDTGAAQSNVEAAAARLEGAEANYNLQTNGAEATQIASAEAQLAQAQATLSSLLEGPTAETIAIAEAEVEQAQLNLEGALDTLQKAAIMAPFDGVITAVYFSEGEFASGPAVDMIDTNSYEVILEVDEVDIGDLHVGQPAVVTLETWPDQDIATEITSISPSAVTQPGSSLVVYEVHLGLGETDLPLRAGMTANANLITAEVKDALLVPNQAINADRSNGTFTVNLIVGEETQEVPVTIGLRDNRFTEIKSGLKEGDQLQISSSVPLFDFSSGPQNN